MAMDVFYNISIKIIYNNIYYKHLIYRKFCGVTLPWDQVKMCLRKSRINEISMLI